MGGRRHAFHVHVDCCRDIACNASNPVCLVKSNSKLHHAMMTKLLWVYPKIWIHHLLQDWQIVACLGGLYRWSIPAFHRCEEPQPKTKTYKNKPGRAWACFQETALRDIRSVVDQYSNLYSTAELVGALHHHSSFSLLKFLQPQTLQETLFDLKSSSTFGGRLLLKLALLTKLVASRPWRIFSKLLALRPTKSIVSISTCPSRGHRGVSRGWKVFLVESELVLLWCTVVLELLLFGAFWSYPFCLFYLDTHALGYFHRDLFVCRSRSIPCQIQHSQAL